MSVAVKDINPATTAKRGHYGAGQKGYKLQSIGKGKADTLGCNRGFGRGEDEDEAGIDPRHDLVQGREGNNVRGVHCGRRTFKIKDQQARETDEKEIIRSTKNERIPVRYLVLKTPTPIFPQSFSPIYFLSCAKSHFLNVGDDGRRR